MDSLIKFIEIKTGSRYFFRSLSALVFFMFAVNTVLPAQSEINTPSAATGIKLKLNVLEDGGPVYGVNIRLKRDTLHPLEMQTIAPDGWTKDDPSLMLTLDPNCMYSLSFSKAGYVNILLSIDTHLPSDLNLNTLPPAKLDLKMLKLAAHPELADVDFPLALLTYDRSSGNFIPSRKYFESVKMMLKSAH